MGIVVILIPPHHTCYPQGKAIVLILEQPHHPLRPQGTPIVAKLIHPHRTCHPQGKAIVLLLIQPLILPVLRERLWFFFPLFLFVLQSEHFSIIFVQYLGVTAGIEPAT
jgi:hypothetical protein